MNLIIAVVVLGALGFGGYLYANRDTSVPEADDLLIGMAMPEANPIDGDLLKALRDLESLKLDGSIFSNPVWLTLKDFGKELAPQAAGRPNPFAPIGGSSPVSAPTGTTTSN